MCCTAEQAADSLQQIRLRRDKFVCLFQEDATGEETRRVNMTPRPTK